MNFSTGISLVLNDINKKEPPRILVIEDDEKDLFLTRKAIEQVWPECVFLTAESLEQAYHIYRSDNPDLTVLDLNLSDAYGAQTVKEVRSFNYKIPIVVVTGNEDAYTTSSVYGSDVKGIVFKSELNSKKAKVIFENALRAK